MLIIIPTSHKATIQTFFLGTPPRVFGGSFRADITILAIAEQWFCSSRDSLVFTVCVRVCVWFIKNIHSSYYRSNVKHGYIAALHNSVYWQFSLLYSHRRQSEEYAVTTIVINWHSQRVSDNDIVEVGCWFFYYWGKYFKSIIYGKVIHILSNNNLFVLSKIV
jgi:hypothetical protein